MKYDVCILILFFIILFISFFKKQYEGFSERDQRKLDRLKQKKKDGVCGDKCERKLELLKNLKKMDSTPTLDQDAINMFQKTSDIIHVYDAPVRSYEDEISDVILNNPIMKLTRNTYASDN